MANHASIKKPTLDAFEPMTPLAMQAARELLSRGGVLVRASRSMVEIRRQNQLATIDGAARVTWRPAL